MPDKTSAVVTTLNEEERIGACLSSLQDQTVGPDEIIVVDAESEDRTREIVKQFDVELVTVSFHNILKSRNKGIEESSYDLILSVDGDSMISKNFLKKALESIEGHEVVGGKLKPHDPNPLTEVLAFSQQLNPRYHSPTGFLIRKEAYISWKEKHWDETLGEIPFKHFDYVEREDITTWTELPSTIQRKWGTVGIIYGTLAGLALRERL